MAPDGLQRVVRLVEKLRLSMAGGVVPFLDDLALKIIGLAEKAEEAKSHQAACRDLVARAGGIVLSIAEAIGDAPAGVTRKVGASIDGLRTALDDVGVLADQLADQGRRQRIAMADEIGARIEKCDQRLTDAITKFGIESHLTIRLNAEYNKETVERIERKLDDYSREQAARAQEHLAISQRHDEPLATLNNKLDVAADTASVSQSLLRETLSHSSQILEAVQMLQQTLTINSSSSTVVLRSVQQIGGRRQQSVDTVQLERKKTMVEDVPLTGPSASAPIIDGAEQVLRTASPIPDENLFEKPLFFAPNLFKRVVEMDDSICRLRVGWDDEPPPAGEEEEPSFWECQIGDCDVNLRMIAHHVPRGTYQVIWKFGYLMQDTGHIIQRLFRCVAGKPVSEKFFMGRTTDPKQPKQSANLDHVIYDRTTITLGVPDVTTQSAAPHKTDVPGSWLRGALALRARNNLEVDEEGVVAFFIKKVGLNKAGVSGALVFGGVTLVPVSTVK